MTGDKATAVRQAVTERAAVRWYLVSGVLSMLYLALSLAVRAGLVDALDHRSAQWGRPDAVWLDRQQLLSHVVTDFDPERMAIALSVLTLGVVLSRRSLRPAVLAAGTGLGSLLIAAGTKLAVGRPDVQGQIYNHGSFPSGHALAVVISSGLALLMLWPSPRWWHLVLPVVPGAVMAVCLVVIGMHWASDAVGSILLGVAALAVAAGWNVAPAGSAAPEPLPDRVAGPESGIRSR